MLPVWVVRVLVLRVLLRVRVWVVLRVVWVLVLFAMRILLVCLTCWSALNVRWIQPG